MMSLLGKIESILFVASKPLSFAAIAKATEATVSQVAEATETLCAKYNHEDCGIHILRSGEEVQMATHAENALVVQQFVKDEIGGELTKAQLETLTVIAYRAPVTRAELEQIRGVNCAIIIRLLMIRGLIDEREIPEQIMPVYTLSFEAMRHLSIEKVEDLPDYATLHAHENIERMVSEEIE